MKYIWPPIMQALEERKKKIAEGLAAADRGQEEMEMAEKKAKIVLKEAKDQSAELVILAQKRANELVEESKDNAKKEGERLILAANSQIEHDMQKAQEGLKKEVSVLALKAAERILESEVDKSKHQDIVSKISDGLGKK
jgi:F-type H+-transporting ATPase subunit b